MDGVGLNTEAAADLPSLSSNSSVLPPTEEHVCRICRGEGSPEDPLFYPCKCRGSIKYIHQGCLEEWLKRSGRDQSCDICHEKYRFTTVYLENTPDRAPVKLILKRVAYYIYTFAKYSLTVFGLVFGCLIQVPLFFEFTKRFMIFFVDSKTTHDDFFISILYGDGTFEGDPYDLVQLFEALALTYLKALMYLFLLIISHMVLFLEHDWVSRDPGFKKLINKNIGRNTSVNEMFLRNNGGVRQIIDRGDLDALLNLVNEDPADAQGQELRRRLIRRRAQHIVDAANLHIANDNNNNERELLDDVDSDEDPDFLPNNGEESSENEHDASDEEEEDAEEEPFRHQIDINHFENNNHAAHQQQDHMDLNEVPDIPNILNRDRADAALPPFPFPIRQAGNPQRQVQQLQVQQAAADLNNNINNNRQQAQQDEAAVDALLDNLPVHIIIVAADILLAVYLTCAYLGPYLVGGLLFHSFAFILQIIHSFTVNTLKEVKLYPFLIQFTNGLVYIKQFNSDINDFLDKVVIDPFIASLSKFYNQDQPLTSKDRLIALSLFYGLLYFGILQYLSIKSKKHNDRNPLKGIQRKIYVLLFDLVCTLKVFLIFSLELVFFPTFCGLLIEFALTPFVHPTAKLILNQVPIVSQYALIRIAIGWAIGTSYMCLFALFVGMTRRYILRPGVLFFIRSPEDPNSRLVHDALVRPLGLQLSRIGLSGFVYTLFILIGFGGVSYGLRLIKSSLVPVDINAYSFSQLPYIYYALFSTYENLDVLKKYIRQYWSRAFKSACTQTRLSSFILGNHNPKERGFVVYKSIFSRLKKKVKPDYSKPKLYSEAKELFKDPSNEEEAFFIPDGNLIRAPKNDIISRKFVKTLFISVTKDDIPLKSKKQLEEDFKRIKIDEFDESEDELTTTNAYEIVYRPPLFGFRVIVLILMIWIFSLILIGGVILTANFIGKPFVFLHFLLLKYEDFNIDTRFKTIFGLFPKFIYFFDKLDNIDCSFSPKINLAAVSIGLLIILRGLKIYDKYLIKKHLRQEGDEVIIDEDQEATISKLIRNVKIFLPVFTVLCLRLVLFTYYLSWNYLIHCYAINRPYNYYFGTDKNAIQYQSIYSEEPDFFTVNVFTCILHVIVFLQNNSFVIKNRLITQNAQIVMNGRRDIVQSSIVFLKYVLKHYASTHLVVILFKLSLSLFEYFNHGDNYQGYKDVLSHVVNEKIYLEQQIYAWPIVLALVLSFKNIKNLRVFLRRVNTEVKDQYYSKGKTLENTQLAEEIQATEAQSVPHN